MEGFLLKTLRDVFVLSSGATPSTLALGCPNPNRDAVPARCPVGSGDCLVLVAGSLMLGRGNEVCSGLPATACALLYSGAPWGLMSILRLFGPGCAYRPGSLLPLLSPGRVGGSKPAL